MPKGTPRSIQEPLIVATIQILKTAGNVAGLLTKPDGTVAVFNHVAQGQARPYLVVENYTAIHWPTMGEHGHECTLQLHAVSEAFGDQECARILDAAIQDLSYSKPALADYLMPALSTWYVVSYKREHEVTFKEELVSGTIVRHHVAVMRVLVGQGS